MEIHVDEATGQPSTAEANQSRKRRRKEGETTSEVESAIVTEETPAKKVLECHVYRPNTSIRVKCILLSYAFFWSCTYSFLISAKEMEEQAESACVLCQRYHI